MCLHQSDIADIGICKTLVNLKEIWPFHVLLRQAQSCLKGSADIVVLERSPEVARAVTQHPSLHDGPKASMNVSEEAALLVLQAF